MDRQTAGDRDATPSEMDADPSPPRSGRASVRPSGANATTLAIWLEDNQPKEVQGID